MKPAICTGFDYAVPFDRSIEVIRKAGFEIIALGARPEHSGYAMPAGRAAIRMLMRTHGMRIDSVHAPFPEGDRLFSLEENERLESVRQCRLAMDTAAELDGRTVVIHLIQPYDIPHGEMRDRMIDQGRRSVGALAIYAEEHGVKLAMENGQKADYDQVVADFLAEFDAPHVGLCYDSGHENVQGKCFHMLERFGRRLLTMHIHDNSGSDIHVLPFEGTTPWDEFRRILGALPYSGNLLLEVDVRNSRFQDHTVFLSEARQRAGRLLPNHSTGKA